MNLQAPGPWPETDTGTCALQPLRDALAATPWPLSAQRIFHGRGGCYPGCEDWTLDAYPPVLLFTSFAPVSSSVLAALGQALQHYADAAGQPLAWVLQERGGPDGPRVRVMAGSVPEPHQVQEDGARYGVHLLRGQNHGLFLDMAQGRRWVRAHAAGARVLNLFAYTCAFSVVALQAGAREVVNVDMGRGALAQGQANHQLNGLHTGARFLAHDVFSSWGKLTRLGPYELVIVDPPSYQKGSFVAGKDYARVLRRLPSLLAPGGHALVCLNAPEWGCDFLHTLVQTHAPGLQWVERVPNPPVFCDVDAERALKVLVYRA